MQLEKEISNQLKRTGNAKKAAHQLLEKYKNSYLHISDFRDLLRFCVRSGLQPEVFQLFGEWFKEQKPIPWSIFCEIIEEAGIKPSQELLDQIFNGAVTQEQLSELTTFQLWNPIDSRFTNYRLQHTDSLKEANEQKHKNLLAKIEYFKSNRMVEEEKRTIDALAKSFPDDPNIAELKAQLQQRWAEHVINSSQRSAHTKQLKDLAETPLSADEFDFAKRLRDQCLEHVEQHGTELAYNFAIMFVFMGLPVFALDLLRKTTSTTSTDWLMPELLILCRLHIDALEKIDDLEKRYASDPEAHFAVNYLRARCYYEMGQSYSAIDLMRQIVSVRPNYRSAHSLLTQWESTSA